MSAKGPEISQDPDRIDDAVEFNSVKPGEYKVRLLSFNTGIDKNGVDYIMPRMEVVEDPYTKDFSYFLGLPSQYDDAKQMNNKKMKIKTFCQAFGINPPGSVAEFKELTQSEDLIGMEAWAVLSEKDSGEYGMQNEVKRFIRPV